MWFDLSPSFSFLRLIFKCFALQSGGGFLRFAEFFVFFLFFFLPFNFVAARSRVFDNCGFDSESSSTPDFYVETSFGVNLLFRIFPDPKIMQTKWFKCELKASLIYIFRTLERDCKISEILKALAYPPQIIIDFCLAILSSFFCFLFCSFSEY